MAVNVAVLNQILLMCKAVLFHQVYSFNCYISPEQKPQPQNVTTGSKTSKTRGHLVTQNLLHLGTTGQPACWSRGSREIFINCVGPQDVFWFCKLLGRACLPVYTPRVPSQHTQFRTQVEVFYIQKTRTFVIRLKNKKIAALEDVCPSLLSFEGCN